MARKALSGLGISVEGPQQKHILLDSVYYSIVGEVLVTPSTPWTAKMSTGPVAYEDYAPTAHVAWENLKGGLGKKRWEKGYEDRYWYPETTGALETGLNEICLPPLMAALGTFGLSPEAIVEFKGNVFAFADGFAAYYDTTNSLWQPCGTLIENCEDAWNESTAAGVTSSLDTSDYKVGSGSAKLVEDGTTAAGTILATEAITSLDLSNDDAVTLWIKSNVALSAGDLQLLLDDTASCASPLESLDIPAVAINTWTLVKIDLANAASDTAIISVGLKMVVDKGAFTVRIDEVRAWKADPTSAYVFYDAVAGDRFLCVGTQGKGIWTTSSATGASWTKKATSGAWLTEFRGRLCALYYQYKGFCYSDVGDLATFTYEANFPNTPYTYNNLYTGKNVNGEDTLYYGIQDGLKYIDFDTLTSDYVVKWTADPDGGKAAIWWKGDHYISTGAGIYKISGSVVSEYGPNLDDGLPSSIQGSINGFIPTDYWLIAYLKSDYSTRSFCLKRAFFGGGWHYVTHFVTQNGFQCGTWYNGTLYLGANSDSGVGATGWVRSLNFPKDTRNVVESSGYEYTASEVSTVLSEFDAGMPAIPKLALRVWALTEGCTANEKITIKYGADSASATANTLGTFTSSPRPTALKFATSSVNVGLSFHVLKLHVSMKRGTTTTLSPKLKALVLEYLPMPVSLRDFQFTVVAETGRGKTGKSDIDSLWTAYEKSTLMTFYPDGDPGGTQYIVKVKNIRGAEGGRFRWGRSGRYLVTVGEVVDA